MKLLYEAHPKFELEGGRGEKFRTEFPDVPELDWDKVPRYELI